MKRSVVLVALLSGCSTYSSNMRIGNDQSYMNPSDQRAAVTTVGTFAELPQGAVVIGPVDASRCHRRFTETEPTDETVLLDLKVAAYARGADGITDVAITKQSALTANCWFVLDARAVAFRMPQG